MSFVFKMAVGFLWESALCFFFCKGQLFLWRKWINHQSVHSCWFVETSCQQTSLLLHNHFSGCLSSIKYQQEGFLHSYIPKKQPKVCWTLKICLYPVIGDGWGVTYTFKRILCTTEKIQTCSGICCWRHRGWLEASWSLLPCGGASKSCSPGCEAAGRTRPPSPTCWTPPGSSSSCSLREASGCSPG